jgi:hypothetical protein
MTEQPLFNSGWEVDGIRDGEHFFGALHEILPISACMVLEGVSIAPDVRCVLESAAVPVRRHIPSGTIFPTPTAYHVPASMSLLASLADLAAAHAEPELCDHFHAYDDLRVLVQWYDAFNLSMLADISIPESKIRKLCDALGATYRKWRAG